MSSFPKTIQKAPNVHHATSGHKNFTNHHTSQLDERLKREGGAKTHKQRVEELNKYLSTLSEHHDMPRIGPG